MFKHLFLGLGAVLLLMAMMVMPVQAATLLGVEPPHSKIVTRGNLEWVWASPCAGEQPSCDGKGDLVDVLPDHRFRVATSAEWNASFNSLADLNRAFDPVGGFDQATLDGLLCGASYFSQSFDVCDLGDLRGGFIWNSPLVPEGLNRIASKSETFLVRQAPVIPTPLPPSVFLFGAGLLVLAAWRWKRIA